MSRTVIGKKECKDFDAPKKKTGLNYMDAVYLACERRQRKCLLLCAVFITSGLYAVMQVFK